MPKTGAPKGVFSGAVLAGLWPWHALLKLSGPSSSLERVMQHWQEDLMFGYQFLNGCNPVLIRRCTQLPPKLPVTTDMVECSLERQLTLEQEIQVGPVGGVLKATSVPAGPQALPPGLTGWPPV